MMDYNGVPVLSRDTSFLLSIRFSYNLIGLRHLERNYQQQITEVVQLIARLDDPGPALYRVLAMYQRSMAVVAQRREMLEADLN